MGDYTEVPHCTPADVASSPSWFSLKRLQERGELTRAQALLFQAPRPHVELYDVKEDPWEIDNLADEAAYQPVARRLSQEVLGLWMEATGDFPPSKRKRADHTDRMTGTWFRSDIPPMRSDVE